MDRFFNGKNQILPFNQCIGRQMIQSSDFLNIRTYVLSLCGILYCKIPERIIFFNYDRLIDLYRIRLRKCLLRNQKS